MIEDIFRRSTYPSLIWEHKFQGTVWRLMPSHPSFLVGECRETNIKNTTYFCVDIFTGSMQLTDLHLEERWWVGKKYYYLYLYQKILKAIKLTTDNENIN